MSVLRISAYQFADLSGLKKLRLDLLDLCKKHHIKGSIQSLRQVCDPLPGSVAATNFRPLRIPGRLDGTVLHSALQELFPQIKPEEWVRLSLQGQLLTERGHPADLEKVVRSGQCFQRLDFDEIEPAVNAGIEILHLDEAILVLNKPAPLPMHPCGRFNRNTLRHILHTVWQPRPPRPAHRLDANTTGVLVCAMTPHFARLLQAQFAAGGVQKFYQAVVHGHPPTDQFTMDAPIHPRPGQAGLHDVGGETGGESLTRFQVLERRADGTSLIEARPLTGRTNQIRIHLWQAGFPIIGDPSYLPGQQRGLRQTLGVGEAPMKLHARSIRFVHPATRESVEYSIDPPW